MKALLNVSLLILVMFPARLAAYHNGPLAVLDARQAAYDAHNVEAAVAFFAGDAVVTLLVGTPRQVQYVGRSRSGAGKRPCRRSKVCARSCWESGTSPATP